MFSLNWEKNRRLRLVKERLGYTFKFQLVFKDLLTCVNECSRVAISYRFAYQTCPSNLETIKSN